MALAHTRILGSAILRPRRFKTKPRYLAELGIRRLGRGCVLAGPLRTWLGHGMVDDFPGYRGRKTCASNGYLEPYGRRPRSRARHYSSPTMVHCLGCGPPRGTGMDARHASTD